MIKYLDLPKFKAIGERGFMSHLYQWMEHENQNDLERLTLLVRAFNVAPIYWIGSVHTNYEEKIINKPNSEIDLSKLQEYFGGGLKQVVSFKDFIKGHEYEKQFKKFEEVTLIEKAVE